MTSDVGDAKRDVGDARTSAWEAAEAYGFDMSLIEANLRRSPAERIRAHARALALATTLQQQMKSRRGAPAVSRGGPPERLGG